MGYERRLALVTDEILALPDVRAGIEDPSNGLNNDFVRRRIEGMADQIFQAAASHIGSFEKQEKEVESARAEFERQTADPGDVLAIQFLFGLGLLALIFGGPFLLISVGPAPIWSWIVSLWSSQGSGLVFGLLIIAFVALSTLRLYHYHRRVVPALRARLRQQLHLDTAYEQLAATRSTADATVREEVLKSILGVIASATQPFYQARLFVPETPAQPVPAPYKATTGRGLSEVVNSTNEVPTAVYRDLLQTFENLPGASIGICGPRGAGKSTLLWSICGANRKVSGIEAIAICTAAPVEYETRDFMLHIFSCVCQRVLQTKGVADDRSMPFDEQNADDVAKPLLTQQSRVGWLLVWLGTSTVILSLFFAVLIWGSDMPDNATGLAPKPIASQSSTQPTPEPAGAGTMAKATNSLPGPPAPAASQPAAQPGPAAHDSAPQTPPKSGGTSEGPGTRPATKRFIEVLELKPGPLLLWGAVAVLLGLLLISLEQLSRVRKKYAEGAPVPLPLRWLIRRPPQTPPGDPLALKAQQHLREIRFQRSYSSGWSGALKIPAGFEMGTTLGTSLAQKQESLPELVERFRSFAELITREYSCVIIGIDELDKLKSEADAQEFVNGIKAIFNIPNCFYLMSVSENAISNFERRGMPFRDEFDSAFDDIRHIDYLTLDGCRHLLGRRVLNLPDAFLCLCYVLSAGLPRDLIRVTRAMLDQAKMHPAANSLKDITDTLIAKEIARKVRAIEIAAKEVPVEPETTEFLRQVAGFRDFHPRSPAPVVTIPEKRPDLSEDEAANMRKLTALRRELDAFVYFSVTTAEFFARHETELEWREAVRHGYVQRLGEARQAFELNVGVVEFRLDELRQACNMPKVQRRATIAEPTTPFSGNTNPPDPTELE
jgi:energy-coupling factor transporter ATP-binding protein EcfA2